MVGSDLLEPDRLKEEAASALGLSEFGDDPYAEHFTRFVDALNNDGGLTPEGAAATEAEILSLLRNRLEIRAWFAAHPEIAEEPIDRPIFLMGLPRSGTTFLHHLFDHDPGLRLLRTWETLRPCPPPSVDPASVETRLAAARQHVGQWQTGVVNFDATHLMDADGPDECALILNQVFAQAGFQNYLKVPTFFRWLYDSADYDSVYRYHRLVLQLLQWQAPPRRWVLKYPNHLLAMGSIRHLHPDTLMVLSHRDPVRTLASLCDLTHQYRAPRYADNDRGGVGQEMWEFVQKHVDRLLAFRRSGSDTKIVDVDYYRLVDDPVATVESVYAAMGWEMPAPVRAKLADWTRRNPKGKRGAHMYSLKDYGLDFDQVEAGFSEYRRLYDIPIEPE
jgi:hypothetical protein